MVFHVLLVRHAEAHDVGYPGVDHDRERPLSDLGVKQSDDLGSALQRLGVKAPLICHSPLLRAAQTARALARRLPGAQMRAWESLAGSHPGEVLSHLNQLITEIQSRSWVILVGHEPQMAAILATIVMGTGGHTVPSLPMRKAAAARLDVTPDLRGVLQWLIPAEVARQIVS